MRSRLAPLEGRRIRCTALYEACVPSPTGIKNALLKDVRDAETGETLTGHLWVRRDEAFGNAAPGSTVAFEGTVVAYAHARADEGSDDFGLADLGALEVLAGPSEGRPAPVRRNRRSGAWTKNDIVRAAQEAGCGSREAQALRELGPKAVRMLCLDAAEGPRQRLDADFVRNLDLGALRAMARGRAEELPRGERWHARWDIAGHARRGEGDGTLDGFWFAPDGEARPVPAAFAGFELVRPLFGAADDLPDEAWGDEADAGPAEPVAFGDLGYYDAYDLEEPENPFRAARGEGRARAACDVFLTRKGAVVADVYGVNGRLLFSSAWRPLSELLRKERRRKPLCALPPEAGNGEAALRRIAAASGRSVLELDPRRR